MVAKFNTLQSRKILILLILADLLFISFHILHLAPNEWLPFFSADSFDITEDLGMAEGFQYIKAFWACLLIAWLTLRERKFDLGGWAVLFGYLFLDDMFSLHENIGKFIASFIGSSLDQYMVANLRPEDIGELLGTASIGLVFLILLFVTYRRAQPNLKPIFRTFTWMLIALLFFGIGLDMLDRFAENYMLQQFLKLIEDGGEMISMSVICWYAYTIEQTALHAASPA